MKLESKDDVSIAIAEIIDYCHSRGMAAHRAGDVNECADWLNRSGSLASVLLEIDYPNTKERDHQDDVDDSESKGAS